MLAQQLPRLLWRSSLAATLISLALASASAGCSASPSKKGPLGVLPTAVTSAQPQWIPFTIRAGKPVAQDPREQHLSQLRQLTTDGTSGAAVWHPNGRQLMVESGRSKTSCGQLYNIDLNSGQVSRVSPEKGWASAAAFAVGSDSQVEPQLLFSFSEKFTPPCAPLGERLLWTLPHCNIVASTAGKLSPVITGSAYHGELSASARGDRLVLTSTRDGDPELYLTDAAGKKLRRITHSAGYDGGSSFSRDGTKLVWHAEQLSGDAAEAYKEQLARGSVEPRSLVIMMASADGARPRVISKLGHFNMTPAFLGDSRRVVFASDRDSPADRPAPRFDLYLVDPDGPATSSGGPRVDRLTYFADFDGAPRISPDGNWIAFTSSRFAGDPGGTNVFVARLASIPPG